ncbi:serine/threonine-protein kinase [[Limnothrix rosea] IAM M-220]|uniref:serine/threonine-protein kinase n=1 Tax=[Limnothrix rosea] IAM M-220 TaxID=454133 RepID=UPI00095C8414|nr:serine/threonine-protein kinase [[Limnothrix rosea] IAM M-220]OKH12914.1 serine/threonine protein kinase [[Limnothrix rosea] IAM M-220]
MSYCINPECENPKNPLKARVCKACGSSLFLRGRYKPLKSLGQGGFGATFLAVDLSLPGKPSCVIKQLRPATNVPHLFDMARELFEREAQTLGRIGNHPQVPRLLDYFEDDKQFYLVQEYVKGNNLQQEVKRNGVFSEAGVRQFLSEILPMVQYIHSQQVIHRDIKPANLIRREQDKKLVLIDFGAVKNRVNPEEAANTSDQTALTSFAVGTPGYAPPEQMAMRPVYASDIYAIGITCLYLLTAKSPKDLDYNPNTGEMMWESYVDISNSFASVMRKMLESSVKHRYQSADDVLNALDMEPYMESLAQGLSTGADGGFSGTTGGAVDPNDPSSSNDVTGGPSTSENSRIAMAIRARRERRKGGSGSLRQGLGSRGGQGGVKKNTLNRMAPGSAAMPHKSASSRFKSKGTSAGKAARDKLDARGLLLAYKKGRRDFGQQNLLSLSLPQSNLSGCIFHQSRMMRANFQGANLANADFGKANLAYANLKDANLGRAYFSYTNLSKADLRGADLSYAYLNYAIVDGTNLCGANLTNAKITEEQLKKAKTNWATIMPNGKRGLF